MDNQFLPVEPKKDTSITTKRQIERGAVSKAVYMVTELFEDGEPLKLALRNLAVDILKDKSSQHTSILKSLLALSKEIGLISELNGDILIRAIHSVEEGVLDTEKNIDISNVLKVQKEPVLGVPHIDIQDPDLSNDTDVADSSEVVQKDIDKAEPQTAKKMEKTVQSPSVTTLDIGTRRKKILEVVRSKGQATIHEFIESIQGCSSKTIQRELTSLVLSGTLKKTGERRWSKYSLR